MKFLSKINRNYLFLLSLFLIVVSLSGYLVLEAIIQNEAKETLENKGSLIEKQIEILGIVPNMPPLIEVTGIDSISDAESIFKEILISDRQENELEPYLEYSKQAEINGHYYSIKLRQSKFENRDLLIIMTLSLFVLLLSAMGISFIITRKMNKSVWANFELNLQKMEAFSFEGHHDLDLPVSGIDEFDRLNKVVNTLTRKLRQDYLSLKELTENASHEIQTPLAIVLLNLEEILQKDISPDMFKKVVTSINALKRLSTLNSSLLLLTKIENGQYEALEKVDMNEIIKQKILEFKPLYEDLNISLNLHEEQEFVIDIDRRLAEIVVNNLLSNAIKYNLPDGNIDIMITFDKLKICNTGQKNDLSEKNIFNRFTKGSSSSSGLGLSIVKSICNIYGLQIRYSKSDLHCFSLSIRH